MMAKPAVKTMPAWFHREPYMIQWERTERWRRRAAEAIERDDAPFDFLLVLFTSIFQMRDWIRASRPDLDSAVVTLYRSSTNLRLARDLANGSKHMTLTEWSEDGAASVVREYVPVDRASYMIPRHEGGNIEALPFADTCIAEVRDFMLARGLLTRSEPL